MSDRRQHVSSTTVDADQLNGWKEIASYIGRGVRSAHRWEKTLRLPVHRIPTPGGEVVFAYRSEIDAWRKTASAAQSRDPSTHARGLILRRQMIAVACAVVLLGLLVSPVIRPASAPVLRIEGQVFTQRAQGDVIAFGGIGFSPGHKPVRSVRRPDGSVVQFEPVLAADPQGTLRGSIATDCATPVGRYSMWYFDDVISVTSNEVTWKIESAEQCNGELADLVAESVVPHRQVSAPGDLLTVTYQLRNAGTATAPPTRTRIRLGRSPLRSTVTDLVLGDDDVPALQPGESVLRTVVWPVPAGAEGRHYVWVVADNDAVVPQASAQNDFMRSDSVTVRRH